jgi:hypothetical protein
MVTLPPQEACVVRHATPHKSRGTPAVTSQDVQAWIAFVALVIAYDATRSNRVSSELYALDAYFDIVAAFSAFSSNCDLG